jgi:hypothetical protein
LEVYENLNIDRMAEPTELGAIGVASTPSDERKQAELGSTPSDDRRSIASGLPETELRLVNTLQTPTEIFVLTAVVGPYFGSVMSI